MKKILLVVLFVSLLLVLTTAVVSAEGNVYHVHHEVYDYDVEALEMLLMKDPILHDEFAQLSKKKKRQLKFLYLRKFNERNPLYIPKI